MLEDKIKAFIIKNEQWSKELKRLRKILKTTKFVEEIKWGMPTYTLDGKNLVGLASFKNHFCLWFHQGVFLKDPYALLHNAQEGKTKGMRQMRFLCGADIDDKKVLEYLQETILNHKAGKVINNRKANLEFNVHPMLLSLFKENNKLKKAFNALSPGKQKEYSSYITDAKRASTKLSRLKKITPLILSGKGLMEKYVKK